MYICILYTSTTVLLHSARGYISKRTDWTVHLERVQLLCAATEIETLNCADVTVGIEESY